MKKTYIILLVISTFISCDKEDVVPQNKVNIQLNFTHNWDETPISSSDFNEFKFTTANGDLISIDLLRYVISNIKIGEKTKAYHMVNLGSESGLELNFNEVSKGNHSLIFTFGFSDAENSDGAYQDLNSVSFNVPPMLGGGYHYLQFDGKYKDMNNEDANFNYHVIRAADRSDPNNLVLEDTSFKVDLGNINITNDTTIEIKMNVAEWFKNPNNWDLNALNTALMPNFEAQKLMNANGKSVFSLGLETN